MPSSQGTTKGVLSTPLILLAGLVLAGSLTVIAAASLTPWTDVPYPDGYRQWVHVSSALAQGMGQPAGLHHIYANDKALEGYRTRAFPEGSILVLDLFETRTSGTFTSAGARRAVRVMRKDRKRFAETGGWGFEEFRGDSRTDRALDDGARRACYACHRTQESEGLLFSTFRP
jgi:hypothetical protein